MSTPTQVSLRNHDDMTIDVIKVNDLDTVEAERYARNLREDGLTFDLALIDRFDGLVLLGRSGNYHFDTPLCGYIGNGPMASARILEMFEFGSAESIMSQIGDGGNNAKYRLCR